MKLNEQQIQAIRYPVDNVAVLSGPGSGKTTVLAKRFAYLVNKKGIDPSQIVAVTFSASMAKILLEKIRKQCPEVVDYNVCTIHAFCYRLLSRLKGNKRPKLAKDWMVRSEITKTANRMQWTKSVRSIRWWVDKSKQDGIPQEDKSLTDYFKLKMGSRGATSEDIRKLVKCALNVRKKLEEDESTTYSDMINETWQLLQKPRYLARAQQIYKHVLVDEGQDTFQTAIDILRLISPKSFFIVGDPDQLLFRFTGAAPEYNLFEVAKEGAVRLETNYRSTDQILQTALKLINHNYTGKMKSFMKNLKGARQIEGVPVKWNMYHNPRQEAESIVNNIIGRNLNPGDVFVGSRTNAQLAYMEQALTRANVSYITLGDQGFFTRLHVQRTIAYLRLAKDEDDASFALVYNIASTDFRPGGKYSPNRYLGEKFLQNCKNYGNCIEAVKVHDYEPRYRFGAMDLEKTFLEFAGMVKSSKPTQKIIDKIIDKCMLPNHLHTFGSNTLDAADDDNVTEDLNTIRYIAKDFKDPEDFLAFIDKLERAEKDSNVLDESVVLGTVHKLKGQERPIVYGIGWNEGILPHAKAIYQIERSTEEDLPVGVQTTVNDERCVAFVLITRAKDEVNLSSVQTWNGKEVEPSRFIGEMGLE